MSFRVPIPVAFLTAVAAGALAVLFGFPTVSPEIGDLVAAGAGIRPPVDVLPGFVRGVFAAFFALLSPADAMAAVTESAAADRRNVNRTLEAIRKAREPKKVR